MPLYGFMPDHFGESNFAEHLLQLDDGRLHLWFDVNLPGVANIDVLIWDEEQGVFCIEVKAVSLEMVEEISPSEVIIRGRGRGKSPMKQARRAAFDLLTYLRDGTDTPPWLTATAGWPLISRSAWEANWEESALPKGYAESLVFTEDTEHLESFRKRLQWIRSHAPWGSAEPRPFQHDPAGLKKFIRCIGSRATAKSSQDAPEPTRQPYRERISLDTDAVQEAAVSLGRLVVDATESMPSGWGVDLTKRIEEIVARLGRPFKLGVVGEFRAGKSSVLNAIVGAEVAVVGELECTFCPHRVAFGEAEATNIFRLGSTTVTTIGEAQRLLQEAEDSPDHNGIIGIESCLPAPILETVDIWDSPGFGGSDGNEAVAEEFVEQIDAALWIFNKDYMGQRALDAMLEKLRVRGKLIIGVVNKCEYLTSEAFEKTVRYLGQAYANIEFAEVIAFSANMALEPESNEGREGLATDGTGNLGLLLETLRRHIIADPSRLTSKAAAGDLRAIAYAARDDIQRELLDERRRLYLFKSQFDRAQTILSEKLRILTSQLEQESLASLRSGLTSESHRIVKKLSMSELRDVSRFKSQIQKSISEEGVQALLDTYFESQSERIRETVRAAGIETFEDYVSRLTQFEKIGQYLQWQVDVKEAELSTVHKERAAGVAVVTGASLGALALAIPGPQWPFVALGVLVSYLGARNMGGAETKLSETELRSLRASEWAEAIERYMESADQDVQQAITQVLGQVQVQAIEILKSQVMRAALGDQTPESRFEELTRLEALRQGAEMIVEELGDPTLELPQTETPISAVLALEPGERSRAQSVIGQILRTSREMIAITDRSLGNATFPILLDVPDDAAIRILAWEQPTSASGEAFRISLSQLREKRGGTVHVVAPITTGHNSEPLPLDSWIFVPGWAYRFSVPILDAWNASTPFDLQPFEDDGTLYQMHFGRWFDDNVPGYQAIQV
jgi:hypothetical protein